MLEKYHHIQVHTMLTGEDLVAKNLSKNNASLPQLGTKQVLPKGTWLEQKQIQAALDTRKQLLSIERIEKNGSISHADWREDLKLAEVTQSVGGHWQFYGHSHGESLFLYPEEALFLLETNRLLLKYNDIPVSLQQACSLLLPDTVSSVRYKVYANLSRLGYKVYRHNKDNFLKDLKVSETTNNLHADPVEKANADLIEDKNIIDEFSNTMGEYLQPESGTVKENRENDNGNSTKLNECVSNKESALKKYGLRQEIKYRRLRKYQKCCNNLVQFPDCHQKQTFIIQPPHLQYLPNGITLKTTYSLNLKKINLKQSDQKIENIDLNTYERDCSNSPRIQSSWTHNVRNNQNVHQQNFSGMNSRPINFSSYNFWRQNSINSNFMNFPRHFAPFVRYQQRYPYQHRNHFSSPHFYNSIPYYQRSRRLKQNIKNVHYNAIKRLVYKLKTLVSLGRPQHGNIGALNNLLNTYNIRYKTKLHLTNNIDLVDLENVTETIEIEDESPSSKKPRLDDKVTFNINYEKLKKIAARLKDMEKKKTATSRHKRALFNAIKTFNKSYEVQIQLDNEYKLSEKELISLDSSSDDEILENNRAHTIKRKVKNPFSIMKKIAEEQSKFENSEPISADICDNNSSTFEYKYSDFIKNTFGSSWLPKEDNFGRAETYTRNDLNCEDLSKEELIYDFFKTQPLKYNDWFHLKFSFWESYNKTAEIFKKENKSHKINNISSLKSQCPIQDCFDLNSLLDKVNYIKHNDDSSTENFLSVDFDVYNRDVKNFKKSKKPKPHFRILCLEESSSCPAGPDLAALHNEYSDGIRIVFAIVGFSCVSYLQLNTNELPVNISKILP